MVHGPARHLLGGHVRHRPHHDTVARLHLGRQLRAEAFVGLRRGELGQAEVEDLDTPTFADHDVGGLQVAMDDSLLVGSGQGVGERHGDVEEPTGEETAFGDEEVEGLSLDELHRQEVDAVRLLDREHADDAGVVEGGQRPGLALESVEPLGIGRHLRRQHLEGHVAQELRVGGPVDLTHPARADGRGDPVVTEAAADQFRHPRSRRAAAPAPCLPMGAPILVLRRQRPGDTGLPRIGRSRLGRGAGCDGRVENVVTSARSALSVRLRCSIVGFVTRTRGSDTW